ncbi:transposase [Chryseobacterium sp. FH1]|nr:transposase [Chryseobacterium sp. FH1]
MKKHILISAILLNGVFYAQSNCDNVKLENTNLKSEIQTIKTENDYLKKVLEINAPILESEKDNNNFRITKVVGNKTDKTITITSLIEAKDVDKNLVIQDISIIDLGGELYKADLFKSSNTYPELSTTVPMKLHFSFKDIVDNPLLIKILRFRVNSSLKSNTFTKSNSDLEFRDLKVIWN